MLRPILLVKIGLGGLVFAARWGQNGAGEHAEEAPFEETAVEEPSVEEPSVEESTVEEPTVEEPWEFLRRHLEYELSGQFARSWDDLHPAHQQVVTRERYAECRAELFERSGPSTELRSFDVLEVTDDAAAIAGIPEESSKAVTVEITIGVNGDSRSALDTLHAVLVDGRWAWVFPPGVYQAYASGSSPAAATS
jgi:hypothetical protein